MRTNFTKKELIQIRVFNAYISNRREKGLEIIMHDFGEKKVILGSPECLCEE